MYVHILFCRCRAYIISVEVTSAITVYRQQVNVVHALRLTRINHTGVHVAVLYYRLMNVRRPHNFKQIVVNQTGPGICKHTC